MVLAKSQPRSGKPRNILSVSGRKPIPMRKRAIHQKNTEIIFMKMPRVGGIFDMQVFRLPEQYLIIAGKAQGGAPATKCRVRRATARRLERYIFMQLDEEIQMWYYYLNCGKLRITRGSGVRPQGAAPDIFFKEKEKHYG